MDKAILVNFHCHSSFSDGENTPESLAANLAAAGVRYAALTDHDTVEGLPRFEHALKKHGIAFLPGLELTAQFNEREIHLLGYGFNPEYPDLTVTLLSLRQVQDLEVHSIAGSLRKMGASRQTENENPPGVSAAPHGRLEFTDAIALLHRSGGRVFLAHPFACETDLPLLDAIVAELKSNGIDGIEAVYVPYSESQRDQLRRLAAKYDLAICAGTDYHATNGPGSGAYSIPFLREDWVQFRRVLFRSARFSRNAARSDSPSRDRVNDQSRSIVKAHHFKRRSYVLRIFVPTLIAIALFLIAIWGLVLPSFENTLLDRKRELIRELTNSAWSILASYERDERSGLVSHEQAQTMAIERIESLRYGPDGKDYFWIQDMQPRMIMHPYRSDLNGQELNTFTDPRGVPIFVEFADLVRREGQGYIDYVWQWNDDPQRLEPKESYVKGFAPWNWVIGTGIYTDDVRLEIARIERNLTNTSLVISGAVVLLLLFVLQQSLRIERERQEVVDNLHESNERYHSLVEATTEGTLLIIDHHCRYANPTFLSMTGYTADQIEFLTLDDLLPRENDNCAIWDHFEQSNGDHLVNGKVFEGFLKHADGRIIECVFAMNSMEFASQRGFILLAREVARQSDIISGEVVSHAAQTAPVGIFRARAARRAVMLDLNQAARSWFPDPSNSQLALADLFSDPSEFDAFFKTLLSDGEVNNHLIHLETRDATARFLSLSAQLVRDDQNQAVFIDGLLIDVTRQRKQEAVRDTLIEKLQSSLLFLHQPIASLGRDVVICNMDMEIEQLARRMTAHEVTAALIADANGAVIGIVTDHDLRARALAGDVSIHAPVHTIMSAPLLKIPEYALIYEALMHMEEKGVRHLAVEDHNGKVVGVVDNKSLIQFQRYGPIVLSREIERAIAPVEIAVCTERTPSLVKALIDSSARPRHVTYMLASICDAATERLVELAIEELGPPPAPFALIAMGSQGRQEQTLVTDQDNGIIFAPLADDKRPEASAYFLRLGSYVCAGLEQAGFPLCRGNVMASNPRWCRSLPDWLSGFDEWVQKSEPQEIIDLSIFFDFRTIYGDEQLTHDLRRNIHTALENQPAFFHHFAQNALMFKPPFRLLGSIYLGGGATDHTGEINLKDAMMPMVSFARLYALRHQVNQTHTIKRVEALCEENILLSASRDEILTAYDFLMQLRLQTQIAAIEAGRPPQNIIHPGKLGYIQQELLKQAFTQIAAVQKKVSYDFLGGV